MAKGSIPIAEFTKAVRKNVGKEARLSVMRGYVGESEIDGNVRLYRDETMRTFVELPEASISHHQAVPNSELGEVFVWINLDAAMPETTPVPRKLGDLLEGSITRDLGGLAAAGLGTGFAAATTPRNCPDGDAIAMTPFAPATTPRKCQDPTDAQGLTP